MSVVNDLMAWLNRKFPWLSLPVLPLAGWMPALVELWKLPVNWQPSDGVPTRVDVELGSPGWRLPVGGGAIVFASMRIEVSTGSP